jgi:hypothetical protein
LKVMRVYSFLGKFCISFKCIPLYIHHQLTGGIIYDFSRWYLFNISKYSYLFSFTQAAIFSSICEKLKINIRIQDTGNRINQIFRFILDN